MKKKPSFNSGEEALEEVGWAQTLEPITEEASNRSSRKQRAVYLLTGYDIYGKSFPIHSSFKKIIEKGKNPELVSAIVDDTSTGERFLFNIYGEMTEKRNIGRSIPRTAWDYTLEKFAYPESEHVKSEPEGEFAPPKDPTRLNFDAVYNLLNNPKGNERSNFIVDEFHDLISCKIASPNQFDEIFTVEKDRPESPLMRRYLNKLSTLVNDEIENSGEINDLEELEKEAYEGSGYVGKSLEVVKQESKDYQDYFKFLITKKEKIVISEETAEYIDELIKNPCFEGIRKSYELVNYEKVIEPVKNFKFIENVLISKSRVPNLSIYYFKHVNNMLEYKDLMDEDYFSMKISLLNELVSDPSNKVRWNLVLFDSLLNCATISIKTSTLAKCKIKLLSLLASFENYTLGSVNNNVPLPFIFNNVTI